MENAAEALKMAAYVMIFVLMLSIAMITLSQARTTSQVILYNKDDRNKYVYVEEDAYIGDATASDIAQKYKTERVVTLDSILPTLYRYYKENYRVEFYKADGSPINLYNPRGDNGRENTLDIDYEMQDNEYWQGSPQATKERLDEIIEKKLWPKYSNSKFIESLGIVEMSNIPESELLGDVNKQTKRIIRYTEIID